MWLLGKGKDSIKKNTENKKGNHFIKKLDPIQTIDINGYTRVNKKHLVTHTHPHTNTH